MLSGVLKDTVVSEIVDMSEGVDVGGVDSHYWISVEQNLVNLKCAYTVIDQPFHTLIDFRAEQLENQKMIHWYKEATKENWYLLNIWSSKIGKLIISNSELRNLFNLILKIFIKQLWNYTNKKVNNNNRHHDP